MATDLAALPVGETLSTRHLVCPASGGKPDHKRRLRYTRADKYKVLYKCHHCGKGGVERVRLKGEGEPPPRKSVSLPYGRGALPIEAVQWLEQAHITSQQAADYGITYSDQELRLILPCRGVDGTLLGCQLRGFNTTPKYITRRKEPGKALYHFAQGGGETVYLVEDILSALRIADAGASAFALLGVSLPEEVKLYLTKRGYLVKVWLDNDNEQVRRCSRRNITHVLQGLGVRCEHIGTLQDPKKYTPEELRRFVSSDETL